MVWLNSVKLQIFQDITIDFVSLKTASRVARGTFTLRPSQTRTWTSRLIRLLSSSPRINKAPMGKQVRLTENNPFHPVYCPSLTPLYSLVFSFCPSRQYYIKILEDLVEDGFTVTAIIIYPSPYYRVVHPGKIFDGLSCASLQIPTSNHLTHGLHRFIADSGIKTDELFPIFGLTMDGV